MNTNLSGVKDRIHKLLKLAENDAATEGEIDNAMRFAARLMAEHHLSEDDCRARPDVHQVQADLEKITVIQLAAFGQGVKDTRWESDLGIVVAQLVGGVVPYHSPPRNVRTASGHLAFDASGQPYKRSVLMFTGPEEEVRLAADLYTTLGTMAATLARMKHGGALRGPGRSYCEGFVRGLRRKTDGAQKAIQEASTTAIVACRGEIVAAKLKKAEAFLEAEGVTLTSKRIGGGEHHPDAHAEGVRDGQQVDTAVVRQKKLAAGGVA